MKGWKTALALGAAAAAAGAVAGEYFYRFALTQQIDKTAAFNAPHNRPTGAPRGTLAADREWLNAQPHEDWWLTSGDGLQLHALCVRAGGNAPWAVLCHGYTGQASGMAEYARRFYDAGFSLLLPDARGHGQSEGRYIGMGWPERRDIAAWVQRVTAENGAPDIVLMGVSMGAATVMMTAGEPLPPNVRAIVEDCGYTTAWEEFRYQLKKTYGLPPFPVLYDYGYAGGLPLAGSELLCLELLEYALDEGMSLGVHYCSLENKHRDQICVQNGACSVDAGVYERDPHDFFLKTVKVFDGDVSLARRALEACGIGAFSLEDEGLSLAFHPRHISIVQALPVVLCRSINVLEETADGFIVRELKLEPLKGE